MRPEFDLLPTRLRKARSKTGLTIYQVGEKVGLSGKAVSSWENGHARPNVDVLPELARIYGVPVSFFFDDKPPLDEQELELLNVFRDLTLHDRSLVVDFSRLLRERDEESDYMREKYYDPAEEEDEGL